MRSVLLSVFLCLLACLGASAQTSVSGQTMALPAAQADTLETDSVVVSLLTCSPGTEVYQLYGHTALRVTDSRRHLDLVFNYGVFDFRTPHFTWRFILGQCDYQVAAYPYELFLEEYRERGSSVTEQVLNLTPTETLRLCQALALNALPENRTYRYDFLRNNCTTRARDMVEQALDGHVAYEESPEPRTYRQLLHRCTQDYPWSALGNDMLLGADCDTLLSDRAAQFLPAQLMSYMEGAQVFDSLENRRPLVRETRLLLAEDARRMAARKAVLPLGGRLTPRVVGWGLVALGLVVALVEYRTRRMWWMVDALLMSLQGVAGLLLCFMFLFSEHPTVDSNWQVLLFHPLALLLMPWVVRSARHRKVCLYHYANMLCLVLFLGFMPWIPQDFSTLTLPLALVLLIRPMSYYLHYSRT